MSDKVDELIITLDKLCKEKHPLSSVVKNHSMLIEGLSELKNMIDMNKIKITIVEQIKLIMTNKLRNTQDNHMLHCIITGKPGQGKTTLAKILAKIWISLDLIKKPTKKSDKNYIELLEKSIIECDYKINKLSKGLDNQQEYLDKIKKGIVKMHNHGKNYNQLLEYVKDAKNNLDKMVNLSFVEVEEEEEEIKFTVATRDMLVAPYVGQTAIKTKAILEKAAGGVLLIDEAYSLYNADKDSFGGECLNVINEFMSLRSQEIIIIFAGYKDLMENLFLVQPGLKRRCMWVFDIEDYSIESLAQIFKKQLEQNQWILDNVNVEKLLIKYNHLLKDAGDTEKLVYHAKIAYAEYHFDHTLENGLHQSKITSMILEKAIDKMLRHQPKNKIYHMYI